MSLIEDMKEAVTCREAAEHYGLVVTRSGMTRCLFHNDRHPSMKLNDSYYYCFSCGAHGDVVNLVASLFNIGSYAAARRLAEDMNLPVSSSPAGRGSTPQSELLLRRQREAAERSRQQEVEDCLLVLGQYEDLLIRWKDDYAPQSREEPWDPRFSEACEMLTYVTHLADTLVCKTPEERYRRARELKDNGWLAHLEAKVKADQEARWARGRSEGLC